MSAPLKDFRGKITTETWCAIEAEHRISGRDHSEIAREVLHAWACERIRQASVMQGLMEAEGIGGNEREARGTRGRGRA